ncbi:phosphotransferase [Actinomadura sediminis]|uniref:Phosphotransferase n=1 Tax=Actinomadura sediminis TaxID=1038904 RepID=A0ABW3EI24_9ACTN
MPRATHDVELSDIVVKRYRAVDHDQPRREWRALRLLRGTGLAPAPLRTDPHGTPPTVVMSRLPGTSLEAFTPGTVEAAARALAALHAVPCGALPARAGAPAVLLAQVREWCATVPPGHDALLDAACAWIARPDVEAAIVRPTAPVFGTGDGNVANFLWDGASVRLVDFEYAGRSDLAYELAEVVEHVSADGTGVLLLDAVALSRPEAARLRECRRLFALYWLLRVRDRPDVGTRQAARLASLL